MGERSSSSQNGESEHQSQERFRKILVGFDGSEHSTKALGIACTLARKYNAGVVVVNVFSSPVYSSIGTMVPGAGMRAVEEDAKKRAEELVGRAVGMAKGEGVEAIAESATGGARDLAEKRQRSLKELGRRKLRSMPPPHKDESLKDKVSDAIIGKDMEHVETRLKLKTPLGEEERIYRKKNSSEEPIV